MEAKWTSYLEQNIWYKVKKQSKLNRTRKLWYLQLRSFYFLNFQIFLNFSHFYFWNRHWALGYFSVGHDIFWESPNLTLRKKWSFLLRNSSVNVTKSAVSCGFRLIYWRKTSFLWSVKLFCNSWDNGSIKFLLLYIKFLLTRVVSKQY